ncbi:50S ribosomal protein L22 [Candidatus Aerophobetes bacterium]|uniref:Large ribosomal subunit protein uL22 n=1 Tax=Aerophobetes bacterium TaxID=2030807 RepID=A0A7V5M075_UNCAE|nr:50S ribosomal protein L22 [Candidatus Aerophobetes bacterium]HHF98504.1 50S ribosomal protein L22 [Candidatus Aerophobetes bacterium]
MEVRAIGRYIRISPFKAQKVAALIRGKPVKEAMNILMLTPKKGARIIKDVLQSAVANAENNYGLNRENLFVKIAQVDKGPTLKRIKPRARGRADLIRKRTSHITIVLDTAE